ncbi:cytosine deaminase [Cohnella herbarum]|uniref:Cytosine deaminase n=1 Tax=Cohnella herbarum TaxID=2728023 RepID=A0A7Z2ZNP5_9BACL|nr:cytosine deaminase [Cohnella herbarum]QJD86661.1 cytosine deaminase [Cohnella herbarum]
MIIVNAALRDQEGLYFIRLENRTISAIGKMGEAPRIGEAGAEVLDAEGGLALPPFIDSHLHYDSALTAGEPNWNRSGTLFDAIELNGERQASATPEDYKRRAVQTIKWQAAQGIQHVRIHADVSGPKLTSLETMLELRDEMKAWMDIQVVAFPQMGLMGGARALELLEEAAKIGADGIGGIPHFEMTRELGVESVKATFDIAERYDRFIDIHCDETDDEHARFIEVVAAEAIFRGMGSRTTASHVTAMHSYNNAYAAKLFGVIKRSGICIVANPLSNISLQGRFDSFPVRRGITRVKPLLEAGVNVSFGHDNFLDAFYSLGTSGMLPVLHMGLHACHMLGYEDIRRSLDLITVNGAVTLGLGEDRYGLVAGRPANLIIMDAPDAFECVRTQAAVKWAVRGGKVLAATPPATTKIFDPATGDAETVDWFRSGL